MRNRDENKVDALLKKALDMIVQHGFEGLSMQKLAKAAGVSPATIYIYFKDKEALILELYKLECEKYFAHILKGFDPEMDFATGLATQWKSRASYVIDNPDKAHFMEHFWFNPLKVKSVKMFGKHFGEVMHRFHNKAIENKELVSMPLEVYWSVAFAPLMNLVRFHKAGVNMAGEKFALTNEMLMQTLALVLKALKP
ncbi:TetR/AcrR family transcriptional regulator [Flavitalea flava]